MTSTFSDFADAMARPDRPAAPAPRQIARLAVLGGGDDARLLAAMALSEGADVTLFSAYGAERDGMAAGIALRGAGPVGSYQVNAEAAPSVKTTAELDVAVQGAEAIFLTGPVHKQRTYAMVLADHLSDGQVLVLPQARTLGAMEVRWLLTIGGCTADVTIVEVQGLPFWARAEGTTLHLSGAAAMPAATLPAGRTDVLAALAPYLPNLSPCASVVHASAADGAALVELPVLLLGGPAIEAGGPRIPMGGTPLAENATFRNLIGADHETMIDALAAERHAVAAPLGVRDLPGAADWIATHAGVPSGDGARPIPDRACATQMIRDGVIGSLVPLSATGQAFGVATPATDGMIAMASALLRADLTSAGRSLGTMGVTGDNPDALRRKLNKRAGLG